MVVPRVLGNLNCTKILEVIGEDERGELFVVSDVSFVVAVFIMSVGSLVRTEDITIFPVVAVRSTTSSLEIWPAT